MNATELSQKICELLTANVCFNIYTRNNQFLVVGCKATFDVGVGGLISTFTKLTTQVDLEPDRVTFSDGNCYFSLVASDVLAIEQF